MGVRYISTIISICAFFSFVSVLWWGVTLDHKVRSFLFFHTNKNKHVKGQEGTSMYIYTCAYIVSVFCVGVLMCQSIGTYIILFFFISSFFFLVLSLPDPQMVSSSIYLATSILSLSRCVVLVNRFCFLVSGLRMISIIVLYSCVKNK
ncbi:hypothetical protein CROQUDRAFT_607217 [Cronartium quercuum f. sp. fusiforme G11]|uniref:Uncharacterized protein n=1 Tax=Cronartium quercuum f. sp. fusiforme G11 TaxID=708437 RepID=A0A9P6TAN8_9BASI|nr:hypothetical protein CROQUDRAFT_607217 [Cronartium quercuum f. sp. fusiforme G11]